MIVAWLVNRWIGSKLDHLSEYIAQLAIEMENA